MTTLPLSPSAPAVAAAAATVPATAQQPAPTTAPAPVPLAQTVEHVSLVPAPAPSPAALQAAHAAHLAAAPQQASALPALPAELAAVMGGISDFSEQTALLEDALPRVFLCQSSTNGKTEHGWEDGKWTHRGTGAQKDQLRMIVVHTLPQRALRPKYKAGADEQAPPVCLSLDGIRGVGSEEHDAKNIDRVALGNDSSHNGPFNIVPDRSCGDCPWSQWDGRGRNAVKPACSEEWVLVGLEEEWGPIAVTLRSTGIAPFRTFKQSAVHKYQQLRALAPAALRALPSQFFGAVTMTPKKESKPGMAPYFVPEFALVPAPQELFASAIDPLFVGAINDVRARLLTREGMAEADTGAADPASAGPDTSTDFSPETWG